LAIHIIKNDGPPSGIIPPGIGVHYIDTLNDDTYLSVGTDSAADWVLQGGSGSSFTDFLALLDTPNVYTGASKKVALVSDSEDSLIFDNEAIVDLKDVDVSGLQDNMVLVYDFSAGQVWKPEYRVYWRNIWAAGTYQTQEMVNDQGWTMIAKLTIRAGP